MSLGWQQFFYWYVVDLISLILVYGFLIKKKKAPLKRWTSPSFVTVAWFWCSLPQVIGQKKLSWKHMGSTG